MKKYIKRIIAMVIAVIMFIAIAQGLRYILVDDTTSYTRIMMHEMYESEQNIDIAFVGSSHVYRSIVPQLMDEGFGCYTFNAGTSSQFMDGSLALIKEITNRNDVKQIYLELYYGVADGTDYSQRTKMTSTYIISDYMKPSFRKVSYLLHASSKDYWINSFVLARRNWTVFFNPDKVKDLIIKKSQSNYKNYEWTRKEGDMEYYVERGFVANDNVIGNDIFTNKAAYGKIPAVNVESDWYKSLDSIVNYCKKQGIELIFFIAPEPEWTIAGKQNYQEYHNGIKAIADDKGVAFYDFNLCRNNYFDTNDRAMFMDEDHLNTTGAYAFSTLFCKFFTGQIREDDLFYDSFQDKLNEEDPYVYGVAGPKSDASTGEKNYYIIANRNSGIYYRIVAKPNEGEQRYIQDFDKNRVFSLPADETGVIEITWYSESNASDIRVMQIEYK